MQDKLRKFLQRPEKEFLDQKPKSHPNSAAFNTMENYTSDEQTEIEAPSASVPKKPFALKRIKSSFNLMKSQSTSNYEVKSSEGKPENLLLNKPKNYYFNVLNGNTYNNNKLIHNINSNNNIIASINIAIKNVTIHE